MKMAEAQRIIEQGPESPPGYRVHFERVENRMLHSDYFPDKDESLIKTQAEAWRLAALFASRTVGRCVNIYVIHADHTPVHGYAERIIENRR